MARSDDALRMYATLSLALGPVAGAWWLADTLDWTPWAVLLAIGVMIAALAWNSPWLVRARGQGRWYVAPALPLWVLAAGLFANAYLDGSPPERHASEVLREAKARKGAGALVFRDFRAGHDELKISGVRSLVAGLHVGDRVVIVARRGLFGWTRVEAIERAP